MAYSYGTELSIDFASVLLLMINWVITLSKWLWNHERQASASAVNFDNAASGSALNFDNVMMKLIINKGTYA